MPVIQFIHCHITKDNYPRSDKEHNPTIAIIELISSCKPTDSLQRVLGLPRGLLPVGRARNTSRGRRPGGILTRYPSHLIWLLSMRSSGSTPSPSRMTELLTLSLRESPDTLRRKPILAACIHDLVLSVTTHNSICNMTYFLLILLAVFVFILLSLSCFVFFLLYSLHECTYLFAICLYVFFSL